MSSDRDATWWDRIGARASRSSSLSLVSVPVALRPGSHVGGPGGCKNCVLVKCSGEFPVDCAVWAELSRILWRASAVPGRGLTTQGTQVGSGNPALSTGLGLRLLCRMAESPGTVSQKSRGTYLEKHQPAELTGRNGTFGPAFRNPEGSPENGYLTGFTQWHLTGCKQWHNT